MNKNLQVKRMAKRIIDSPSPESLVKTYLDKYYPDYIRNASFLYWSHDLSLPDQFVRDLLDIEEKFMLKRENMKAYAPETISRERESEKKIHFKEYNSSKDQIVIDILKDRPKIVNNKQPGRRWYQFWYDESIQKLYNRYKSSTTFDKRPLSIFLLADLVKKKRDSTVVASIKTRLEENARSHQTRDEWNKIIETMRDPKLTSDERKKFINEASVAGQPIDPTTAKQLLDKSFEDAVSYRDYYDREPQRNKISSLDKIILDISEGETYSREEIAYELTNKSSRASTRAQAPKPFF